MRERARPDRVREPIEGEMSAELRLGDIVRLKKSHPCGGYEWEVVRLGADVGLVCKTCNRRVMLTRSELERRLKGVVAD